MSQLSFTHVPSAGFSAFGAQLSLGPWGLVDTSAYENQSQSLWNAPAAIVVKMRLKRVVQGLFAAIAGAGGAKACNRRWIAAEKQLHRLLAVAAGANEQAKQDAAARLESMLLLGAGEAQTLLRYQEKVDFGRKQVALMSQAPGAADVTLLGLGPMVVEIAAATDALAVAIGHGETNHAPYRRKSKAVMDCIGAFAWAAETLSWMERHAGAPSERELAQELYASLEELVDRYGAPVSAPEIEQASPPSVH